MPAQEDFIERATPFRAELIAHCYRMLGSVHDAEDLVQETYLRGWRGYQAFEERAALRTWLYRIATTACLRALQNRARRVLPAGLGDGSDDPDTDPDGNGGSYHWIEPLPDALTPETAFGARQSVRLAVATALQELPARQRAVLILRDVLRWQAAEVADLLGMTTTAVNGTLRRARARLEQAAPDQGQMHEPADPADRNLLDKYATAFQNADITAVVQLLREDAVFEMPPEVTWFTGRELIGRFLQARVLTEPGRFQMIPVAANSQPALAAYLRDHDGVYRAHSICVLTIAASRVARVTSFNDPSLFATFGLPEAAPAAAAPVPGR